MEHDGTSDVTNPVQSRGCWRRVSGPFVAVRIVEVMTMTRFTLCLLVLLSVLGLFGCGTDQLESAPVPTCGNDAGVVQPEQVDSDAGATQPDAVPTGEQCWCCVWAPGSSYPNGDVYCMAGLTADFDGEVMCDAHANDVAPSYAPGATVCTTDNPWGAP